MKPEKVFKSGLVQASVFYNKINVKGKEVSIPNVSFSISYKDKEGNWKDTNKLDLNTLPKAIFVLTKTYEYLIFKSVLKENAIRKK